MVQGYPALTDNGVTASLRLYENPATAAYEHRRGVRRLGMIALADALTWQFKILTNIDRLVPLFKPLGNKDQLRETFSLALCDHLLFAQPNPIRTKLEFELRLDGAWNNLRPAAEQLARTAEDLFTQRNDVAARLAREFAPLLLPAVSEMRDHLARLCPSNVLCIHPWEWLQHVPRFISGIRIRLHKLTNAGLLKDAHNATLVNPLWQLYLQRKRNADQAGTPDPELLQFRYLIEELRVSLFAQELKTSLPVSVAKLQKHFGIAV
jgi:ATP-dependent helicase HrpA